MAITKLTELETAVADRLARYDFTTAQIDECIAISEARMQRQLRTLDMETKTATFSLDDEYVAVPLDFLAVRDFYVTTSGCRTVLEMVSPDYLSRHFDSGTAVTPTKYAIVGRQFRFGAVPSGAQATLVYYAKIPALSTSNITNWVLRDNPDAYLYGALLEAAIRLQDAQAATGYGNLFSQALDAIQSANNRNRWSGPAMASRPG